MTNKINKEIHEKHAKRLSVIINAQSTFAGHLTRPEFATVLKTELNTLAEIEKKFSQEKLEEKFTSEFLTKEFVNLSKTEFKLGENFKYDDEDDLIDNINYLPTYCKNIFKVEIDDAVEGKKVVAENPNINLGPKPDASEPSIDAAAAFNMGSMGYATSPYENPYLMGKAYSMLTKDISEGKVYQYNSKPKAVIIVKYVMSALIGLSMLALIAIAIFCFMSQGLTIQGTDASGNTASAPLSCVSSGVFYLVCAGFGGYILYTTVKTLLKVNGKTNDNLLYSFNWYFYLSFIILSLLVGLIDLRNTWFHTWEIVETSGSRVIGFNLWKVGLIVSLSITGASLVPMIIGAIFAPKQNKEKIQELLKGYIDQAVKSSPIPPTAAPAQSAEVQKPVEVKPVEDKKDTTKTSDDSKVESKEDTKK